MSLTSAIGTAVRGLGVVQDQISNASNNVANVSTPGYIKQRLNQATLVVDGIGQGVYVSSIEANVDEQLLLEMQRTSSTLEKANRVEAYYEQMLRLYGSPSTEDGLSSRLSGYFTAMQNLSDNPQAASARLAAVTAASDLANEISGTVDGLQQLRFDADQEIASSLSSMNSILSRLHETNRSVGKFPEGTEGRATIDRERSIALRELSEFIDISYLVDSQGILSVLGAGGTALLDNNLYQLSYSSAASKATFTSDSHLNSIIVTPLDGSGNPVTSAAINMTSSGRSSTITTNISNGVLEGMLELRDDIIPKLIEQIDTFADVFRDEANAIHNQGSSFPPPTSLTGVKSVASNTQVGFSGKVMIAVVDQDGTPSLSPYGDETNYRPLTLNLASLESGSGAGRPDVQTIIDEINLYYGPVQNRASIGNLRDIRLAAVSDSITDGGTAQFDLELDNVSAQDATVVVQSITVLDASDLSGGYNASTLPSPNSYVVNAGDRERTGIPLTVNFTGGDNADTYIVRVQIQVTAADGTISSASIDFNVDDDVTGIRNDRYIAQDVTNVSGTSSFIEAPSSQAYAVASLVDADGEPVAAGQPGFLKIVKADGTNFGIAIDELDSRETGTPSTPTANITYRGFSHFFGLNDLFTRNNEVISGSAINLAVRSDIAADANRLAIGKLSISNQPVDTSQALYTYELANGNNQIVRDMANLEQSIVTFSATDTLPQTISTFSSYAGDVTGFVAVQKNVSTSVREIAEIEFGGLQALFQEQAGVNTDEELALIIQLENEFRAMAQVISMARSMLETLTTLLGR